ncbi:hypothetical protein HWB57_gp163 [Erwinia phage vB_EamM-Bue1]|uniref:Amino acid:DNA transferase domain-containing protein n=1 Tax=Erwinia phage vB_EamM-Bue1 TaxID=2099338 RepID=A0A2P1JUH5_9CAUD|nr:hypothetical protein HWB57_gp163 [Erwinia phage vB_EamM-Bue1]AVO23009.1 hypothetical protein [Erwinia phage vB_EamM-Bue1]
MIYTPENLRLSKLPGALGYQPPESWKYPIDLTVDYRLPEHRPYLLKAWLEALSYTEEHNQQLRLMDYAIEKHHGADVEMKIWLAFLWGCCYNAIGPWTILSEFPYPPQSEGEMQRFKDWYNLNFDRMRFDTDCRYRKSKMIACVQSYVDWVGDIDTRSQFEAFEPMLEQTGEDRQAKQFQLLWDTSMSWKYFGRLSCWNFLEALNLVFGNKYKIDVPGFMLRDREGSESNRNGAAFMSNRDDWVTKHGKKKINGCPITDEECDILESDLEEAFLECKMEFGHITFINRLNFETSGACWLKKFFREKSTRYIGWDAERTWEEIDYMEREWPEYSCAPLWEARAAWLPDYLLCEKDPSGERGVRKWKMPVFFRTGAPLHIWHLQQGTRWINEGEAAKTLDKALAPAPKSNNLLSLFGR